MKHVALSLAEPLRAHMQAQVESGGFRDEAEYLRSLVASDLERVETLRKALQKGLDSGTSDLTIDDIFQAAKQRHLATRSQ